MPYAKLDNGINVFYREGGDKSKPTILLLHGYPASSFQFRNLIPILATKYHVIAPDYPGFGFTEVPANLDYEYTFANLTDTIDAFLEHKQISRYAIYIFDYGAPVGLRLTLKHPERTTAIISQNGNAYDEGLSSWWDPLRKLWAGDTSIVPVLREAVLKLEATKAQYFDGEPDPLNTVDPATYTLDQALIDRPGNKEIQLALFKDYGENPKLYPKFQEYFRQSQVPVLAVWGKNDVIFPPEGALAFKRDVKGVEVELLDGGHFLVETRTGEIGERILRFLSAKGI